MMKIEELANSTYFLQQHSGGLTDEELEDVEHGIKVRREAFVRGAKAVLEELEMTVSVSEKGYLESNLMKLIKDLKG